MPWKGNWSCLPVTGQSTSSPPACNFTHRGCAGAAHTAPTEGWETRRSCQVHITNCTEGDWFQVLTTQAHMQTGQCNRDSLLCLVLRSTCSFPVSFQHWKLPTSEEARSRSPLQHGTGNATAPRRSLDMPQLLWYLRQEQTSSVFFLTNLLQPVLQNITLSCSNSSRHEVSLMPPEVSAPEGLLEVEWPRPDCLAWASPFDWGGGGREETQTFITGHWAHALKAWPS